MAAQPPADQDEELLGLLYQVRRLIAKQRYLQMQQLVAREAQRRGVTPFELARQIGQLGIERGVAQAPEVVVLPEVTE